MRQMTGMLIAMACLSGTLRAQQIEGVRVDDLHMERNGNYLEVRMNVVTDGLQVENNRAVLLTPSIVQEGTDSLALPSIGIYGRTRYYQYVRGEGLLSGPDEDAYRASEMPDTVAYRQIVPYESWMNHSQLGFMRRDFGCCRTLLDEQGFRLDGYHEPWKPVFAYVRPKATGEKVFSLSGSAFVDFPVDQTVIYPDYRRNTTELGRIAATIDSVRGDHDITITSVHLKGYASPEGTYAHNTYLSKERTAALKRHILGFTTLRKRPSAPTTSRKSGRACAAMWKHPVWHTVRKYWSASTLRWIRTPRNGASGTTIPKTTASCCGTAIRPCATRTIA